MVLARIPFQTQARAGAVALLEAYGASASIKLQVWHTRPRSLNPPVAFVDMINETLTAFTITARQRRPVVEVIVVHGPVDGLAAWGDAANQRDAFVDGFADWVAENFHAFGANTLVENVAIQDITGWVPEWMPDAERRQYYATQLSLEGLAAT